MRSVKLAGFIAGVLYAAGPVASAVATSPMRRGIGNAISTSPAVSFDLQGCHSNYKPRFCASTTDSNCCDLGNPDMNSPFCQCGDVCVWAIHSDSCKIALVAYVDIY